MDNLLHLIHIFRLSTISDHLYYVLLGITLDVMQSPIMLI